MRTPTHLLSALAGLALAAGCIPGESSSSSSSSSSGASGTSGSSSGGGSSGTSGASSQGGSSGATSSGSGGASSQGGSSGTTSSGGSSSGTTSSGGSSGGACPIPPLTLCDGTAADGVDRVVVTNALAAARGVDGLVTLGMTRAQVRVAFGGDPEQVLGDGGANPLPFRVFYCAKRISVTYADTPNGEGTLAGTLTDDDVVRRIAFFDGFAGHTDTDIRLGDPLSEVDTYGTAATDRAMTGLAVLDNEQVLYPKKGVTFTHDGTRVTAMAVHAPYNGTSTPTPASSPVRFADFKVGDVTASALNGTLFSAARGFLGEPDVEGFAVVGSQAIALQSYSDLGIRLVALRSQGEPVGDQNTFQVWLTPPFAGLDSSNVVGIGSTKAEWDAAFPGQGQADVGGITFEKYKVGTATILDKLVAVSFIQDEQCVPRAGAIIVNFFAN